MGFEIVTLFITNVLCEREYAVSSCQPFLKFNTNNTNCNRGIYPHTE